jgi:peptidyl-dipeptidase A
LSTELELLIEEHVGRAAPIERACNQANWMANATGEHRYEEESARLTAELRRLHSDRERFQQLQRIRAAQTPLEPRLARQLTLLLNAYGAWQGEPEEIQRIAEREKQLEGRFNTFRARWDGRAVTDNEIRGVLAASGDAVQRREAWEASKQVGAAVREGLLELVEWRNQLARRNGYADYFAMMLTLDELDEAELFATLEALDALTRGGFRRYKQSLDVSLARGFGCDASELRPWHYGDPFFQEAPASEVRVDHLFADTDLVQVARGYFGALGFDLEPILARSDLFERPGKCQHAFCMDLDRDGDVRILCNLRPNEYWMGTLLHELGHAVYDRGVDRSLPWLLRGPAHTLTTEAVAMLFGRLSKRSAWLERYLGVPAGEAQAAEARLARATRGQLLVQTRWCLVMTHFERRLYRDPSGDLDGLWWDLVERYQEVRRPEGRRAPDWAAKIHFSVAPVYYHNYMLGEMMASQLESCLLDRVGGSGADAERRYVTSPEVGTYLRERLFSPGRSRDWSGALVHATGRRLDAESFAAGLAIDD